MTLQLDHAVIAVADLDAAVQDYRALGFTVVRGGVHANRATHNALITFADETYLELLAATGEPPIPGAIDFGVLLRHGEGLAGYALRTDDLDAERARLRAGGVAVGEAIPGERRRADGTVIRWKLALLDGGFAPFLIEDVTPREGRIARDPAVTAHANGARGLRGIEIAVREMDPAAERYAQLFGAPPGSAAGSGRAIGCVTLREMPNETAPQSTEALVALQLVVERAQEGRFSPTRAHGVRFRQMAAPGDPHAR